MPLMADEPLQGKIVMVTRPAHQANHLCQLLEKSGARPLRFPVLEIAEPADQQPLLDILQRLDQFDLAIFISPNAVSRIMNLLHARSMTLPHQLKLATIGKSSARELKSFTGKEPDIVPDKVFNSEALLDLDVMSDVANKKIVIFRGEGGRELLAETLRERGAQVEYANAYRRIKPHADFSDLQRQWARERIDFIIVSSGEGLRNLFDMVGQLAQHWLRDTRLVVINQRLVDIAKELGFKHEPIVSNESSDEAIVNTLCTWQATQKTTDTRTKS